MDKGLRPLLGVVFVAFLMTSCSGNLFTSRRDVPVMDGVIHTVNRGETVTAIARAYQISPQLLMRRNNLRETDTIYPGMQLFVPGATEMKVVRAEAVQREEIDGLYHTVQPGETLIGIARAYSMYGVTLNELQRVNNIPDASKIYVGQRLWIPRGMEVKDVDLPRVAIVSAAPLTVDYKDDPRVENIVVPKPTPTPVVKETQKTIAKQDEPIKVTDLVAASQTTKTADSTQKPVDSRQKPVKTIESPVVVKQPADEQPIIEESKEEPASKPAVQGESVTFPREVTTIGDARFQWPLKGNFKVLREFNSSFNDFNFNPGIDLGADIGTEVYAAADGVVHLVGGVTDGLGSSLGNHIIIYHGERDNKGIRTLYAHNSQNLVQQGQKVKRGEPIAKVGNTGRPSVSNGGVLHFEIRELHKPLDPRQMLPPLR